MQQRRSRTEINSLICNLIKKINFFRNVFTRILNKFIAIEIWRYENSGIFNKNKHNSPFCSFNKKTIEHRTTKQYKSKSKSCACTTFANATMVRINRERKKAAKTNSKGHSRFVPNAHKANKANKQLRKKNCTILFENSFTHFCVCFYFYRFFFSSSFFCSLRNQFFFLILLLNWIKPINKTVQSFIINSSSSWEYNIYTYWNRNWYGNKSCIQRAQRRRKKLLWTNIKNKRNTRKRRKKNEGKIFSYYNCLNIG